MNTPNLWQKYRRKKRRLILVAMLAAMGVISFIAGALSDETANLPQTPVALVGAPSFVAPATQTAFVPQTPPASGVSPSPPVGTLAPPSPAAPIPKTIETPEGIPEVPETASPAPQTVASGASTPPEKKGNSALGTPNASDTIPSSPPATSEETDTSAEISGKATPSPDAQVEDASPSANNGDAVTELSDTLAESADEARASEQQTEAPNAPLSPGEKAQTGGSEILLPSTGQESVPPTLSLGGRYLIIGFILILLAGGVLAGSKDGVSPPDP